jgi:molybdenum cofactor cytidylyltransferase
VIAGIVLAAGGSQRFGSPKQLAVLRGQPLLRYPIEALQAVPAIGAIVVVLGAHAEQIRAGVDMEGVEVVLAPDWEEGIAASLRAGLAAVADAEAAIIALGDQPLVTPQLVAAVLDQGAGPRPAARATFHGAPGHPVLLKRGLFRGIARLRGDAGAGDLLAARDVAEVEWGSREAIADVDTVQDLAGVRSEAALGA